MRAALLVKLVQILKLKKSAQKSTVDFIVSVLNGQTDSDAIPEVSIVRQACQLASRLILRCLYVGWRRIFRLCDLADWGSRSPAFRERELRHGSIVTRPAGSRGSRSVKDKGELGVLRQCPLDEL